MSRKKPDVPNPSQLRERALARWDNEGGAGPDGPQEVRIPTNSTAGAPDLGNAELVQLQVRMIALENLVIALLAQASPQQLELARDMAAYISPRPGFTPHRLTIHAAAQMVHIVERAVDLEDSLRAESREPAVKDAESTGKESSDGPAPLSPSRRGGRTQTP